MQRSSRRVEAAMTEAVCYQHNGKRARACVFGRTYVLLAGAATRVDSSASLAAPSRSAASARTFRTWIKGHHKRKSVHRAPSAWLRRLGPTGEFGAKQLCGAVARLMGGLG